MDFLENYMAKLGFAHVLCETTKPTIVLSDNKSVRCSFQAEAFPPPLWNSCEYVLQFSFQLARTIYWNSKLEPKFTENIRLNIR